MKRMRERPVGRTLHLVDLENLLGDYREHEVAVEALHHYLALARRRRDLRGPARRRVVSVPQLVVPGGRVRRGLRSR